MKLFEPGKIGKLELKNRIVMGAIGIGSLVKDDCTLSQEGIDYYEARAKGGVGLITTGAVKVSREIEAQLRRLRIDGVTNDGTWLRRLTEAVHRHGAKLAIQLCCGLGRVGSPGRGKSGGPMMGDTSLVSPSPVPCFWDSSIIARELTTDEVERLAQSFGPAAELSRRMGADAIELHGHSGYLFDEFMTECWNKRTDKYGSNLNNRLRFVREVIQAIRAGAGHDYPIIYRLGVTHYMPGGRSIEEGLEIARQLEAAGIDALNIDAGAYETHEWVHPSGYTPPGSMVHLAEMVKKAVKIPVIAVGKLQFPDLAETVLREGKADFILLAKALLADPEWPNKVKEQRLDDIRPCIGDFVCLERGRQLQYMSCSVNPATGAERASTITPADKKRAVLVVGGGPGGMEAAIVSALRGHRVTLWEKGRELGGALIAASVPDFKKDYRALTSYLSNQVRKLGVKVELDREATRENVLEQNPDAVIIATGSDPVVPEVPGINKKCVHLAIDVLMGKEPDGEIVAIIGGGLIGCEVGLYLAQKGKKVQVIARHEVASDVFWASRFHLMKLLDEAKVAIKTNTNIIEIKDGCLVLEDQSGNLTELLADAVIIASGFTPNSSLYESLKPSIREVYAVGDCVEPRRVKDAIWEAFEICRLL